MKKLLAALLAALLVSAMAGCQSQAETFELALVTDIGTIDDKSFNQGAWEGIEKYAQENNKTYRYFQPQEQSMASYNQMIDLAVESGAKIVVTPGYLFENSIHKAQAQYPDVNFILIDGAPHNVTNAETNETYDGAPIDRTIAPNTYSIFFKEEQAGFLAGYAAVKDGYKKLGFMGGMAVPAVVRYGYGFVQGADYAAKEMGAADIDILYHYTGDFRATPEVQTKAASWYGKGVEAIFACGGQLGDSVMEAAKKANTAVIGVDVDQSSLSDSVITSAMKNITQSVYDAIKAYYGGSFPGGRTDSLGAEANDVGLPMATSKFRAFAQADYDRIFNMLKDDTGGLASSIKKDDGAASVEALGVANAIVNEEK
ncbi:MAG: BMP family ABC transporter substrate-binding protein [Eubacteriaceae bacterium]|jgi:basic membrane protein A|nr:BMP family ABC transporter substrate-binding protein [Eubacteriaceae bacterium]